MIPLDMPLEIDNLKRKEDLHCANYGAGDFNNHGLGLFKKRNNHLILFGPFFTNKQIIIITRKLCLIF